MPDAASAVQDREREVLSAHPEYEARLRKQEIEVKVTYRRVLEAFVDWLTPERLRIYPPHIPVITVIAWGASQLLGKGLTDSAGNIIGSDFMAFYGAGKFFLQNRMNDLYNLYEQSLFQESVVAPVVCHQFSPFMNPPFTVGFFSLFAHGSYLQGLMLWWLLGLLALWGSVYLFRREISSLGNYSTGRLFLMCFLFFPTLTWFMYGQNAPFTLLMYTGFYVMLRRERDFLAGCILGLLLYKPQLAVVLMLVLFVNLRWRAVLGTILSAACLLALGFLTAPDAMIEYATLSPHFSDILRLNPDANSLSQLFHLASGINYPTWGIHSLFGFSVLLLDNIWKTGANALFIGLTVGGMLFVVLLWRRIPWEPRERAWDLAMAMTFTLALIVSPHLFIYDMMLFLLPLAIVWGYYPNGSNGKPLDGGPILFWSALVYIVFFLGSYLSAAQLKLTALAGLPQFAVQISTIIVVGWIWTIYRCARDS